MTFISICVGLAVLGYIAFGVSMLFYFRGNPPAAAIFFGMHMMMGAGAKSALAGIDFSFKASPTWDAVAAGLRITSDRVDVSTIVLAVLGFVVVVIGFLFYEPANLRPAKVGGTLRKSLRSLRGTEKVSVLRQEATMKEGLRQGEKGKAR